MYEYFFKSKTQINIGRKKFNKHIFLLLKKVIPRILKR